MIVSGAAPSMVDALRRVRRCMSRRVFCRFCHARSPVPIVFDPFHFCVFCERAEPDAPETIHDQRRCTRCRYRIIYSGSRESASLPRRRSCTSRLDTSLLLIELDGALYLPFTPFACLRSMNVQRRSRRSATLSRRARPHADTCQHQPPATSSQML